MSESEYRTAAGFIQFDPRQRPAGGKQVRNVTIRAIGSQNYVDITVWPEHDDVALEKGMFIVADGKFSTNAGQDKDGNPRTYYNLSATNIAVLSPAPKRAREVVSGNAASTEKAPF